MAKFVPLKAFTSETARTVGRPGRVKGQRNKWRKADLLNLRTHLEEAANGVDGGLHEWLQSLMKSPKMSSVFAKLISEQAPKPPAVVQADAKITISWADEEESK